MVKENYYYVMYREYKEQEGAGADIAAVDIRDVYIHPLWITLRREDKKWIQLGKQDYRRGQLLVRWAAALGLFYLRRKYVFPLYQSVMQIEQTMNAYSGGRVGAFDEGDGEQTFVAAAVLAEKTAKELPGRLWKQDIERTFPAQLYQAFGESRLSKRLKEGKNMSVYIVTDSDTQMDSLSHILLAAAEQMKELEVFLADFDENPEADKGWQTQVEEMQDLILEETGLATDIHRLEKPVQILEYLHTAKAQTSLLMDYAALPVNVIKKVDIYIDAAGKKNSREIRKLENERVHCESLHNYLDRAFLGTL